MAQTRRKATCLPATKKNANPNKVDCFAVGVSPTHYWFIDALAHAKDKPRAHILENIITHYIQSVVPNSKL